MKTLIWKLRFCLEIRRLLRLSWLMCWQTAEANLEMLGDDLSECPVQAANDEFDAWTDLEAWRDPAAGKL